MWRKHLSIVVLVSVCTLVGHATAQKNELSGLIGRTFISDQIIPTSTSSDNLMRFGDGLTFEANYARRLMDLGLLSLSFEVPVVFNPDEDLHAALPSRVPQSYNSIIVTPAARLSAFPDLGVSPWVSLGGGVAHYGKSSTLLFGGTNTGQSGTNTGVLQIGGGLDVKFFKKFSLRGELRDYWSGTPNLNVSTNKSRQHNLFVGGGIVWHFGR